MTFHCSLSHFGIQRQGRYFFLCSRRRRVLTSSGFAVVTWWNKSPLYGWCKDTTFLRMLPHLFKIKLYLFPHERYLLHRAYYARQDYYPRTWVLPKWRDWWHPTTRGRKPPPTPLSGGGNYLFLIQLIWIRVTIFSPPGESEGVQ